MSTTSPDPTTRWCDHQEQVYDRFLHRVSGRFFPEGASRSVRDHWRAVIEYALRQPVQTPIRLMAQQCGVPTAKMVTTLINLDLAYRHPRCVNYRLRLPAPPAPTPKEQP